MKKGFILIELLAVIVIFAIVTLIATPIILRNIRDAKVQANQRSIDNYAKIIENSIVKNQGFNIILTCRESSNKLTVGGDLWDLGRFNRPYGKSSESFFNSIS